MANVTVRWHREAEAELAALWLAAADRERDALARSSNELDVLLRVSPSSKGRPFGLAMLDEAAMQLVVSRIQPLPEDLRFVAFGPLEFFFLPREADGMALIVMVQRHTR